VSTASSVVELAVGLVCLVGAIAAWSRRLLIGAALLAIAGLVAIVHAVLALAG